MLEREPTDAEWQKIERGVELLVNHPVWSADYEESGLLKELQQALLKNQDVQKIFPKLGLKLAYLVEVEKLDKDWFRSN
jgi:hypothetical protein